jgi:radical SAM protein with 4Fe4S-binding SPASM domain
MTSNREFSHKIANLVSSFHTINASVEVTGRCNASCGYCYIKQEEAHPDLSIDKMKLMVDKLYDAGVLFLCLTGGEPFLRPDILDLLSYCIEKNFFKISVLTNGTHINDDHIKLIGHHREFFSYIRMSVFSHIPQVHDAYFGVPNSLAIILENAKKLRAAGVQVLFSFNILDFNYKTHETTKRYLEDLGFPVHISISKLISSEALGKTLKPLTQKDFFLDYLRHSDKNDVLAYKEGLKRKILDSSGHDDLCAGLSSNIHVKSNGDITPCASFRKFIIGSIFKDSAIPDILRGSEKYVRLRSMRKTDTEACRQCRYLAFCFHCMGIIHSEFNDFSHTPEQFCNFHKALHEIDYA